MNKNKIEIIHQAGIPKDACFSIMIPSWNNYPYLKLCIESIRKNSAYPHQILVHINEGNDESLNYLKSQNDITVTFSKENAGVCTSLNKLATLAQTDYLLYMNDDMYVAPQWDHHLFHAIKQRSDNLFYYSSTMVEFEDTGNKAVMAPHDFGRTFDTFDEQAFLAFAGETSRSHWWGSCWPPSIVHRKLWNQAGGYDEAYSPGFYSDPDFAMKLWELGVRDFKGIGNSLVYHFRCKSTGRVVRNDGRKTFAAKWGLPSSFFYQFYLRMGEPTQLGQELKKPSFLLMLWARIKGRLIAGI